MVSNTKSIIMNIFETLNHVKTLVKLHKEEGISATVTTDVTLNGKDSRFWIDTEDNISFEIGNGIKQVYEVRDDYTEACIYLRGWDERLKRTTLILIITSEIECTNRIRIEQH
jgi:uncharacterized protein YxjI